MKREKDSKQPLYWWPTWIYLKDSYYHGAVYQHLCVSNSDADLVISGCLAFPLKTHVSEACSNCHQWKCKPASSSSSSSWSSSSSSQSPTKTSSLHACHTMLPIFSDTSCMLVRVSVFIWNNNDQPVIIYRATSGIDRTGGGGSASMTHCRGVGALENARLKTVPFFFEYYRACYLVP